MSKSTFVYVTFIRTSPERLWEALTSAPFIQQYWFGVRAESTWKAGAPWRLVFPDGRLADTGEVLEAAAPQRLVIKWRNEFQPELKAEGYSQCRFELEPKGDAVKLTVTHSMERANSVFVEKVSDGWPAVLSNLKSLLETGAVVLQSWG